MARVRTNERLNEHELYTDDGSLTAFVRTVCFVAGVQADMSAVARGNLCAYWSHHVFVEECCFCPTGHVSGRSRRPKCRCRFRILSSGRQVLKVVRHVCSNTIRAAYTGVRRSWRTPPHARHKTQKDSLWDQEKEIHFTHDRYCYF